MKPCNKLVRDRVPDIISKDGRKYKSRILDDDDEYFESLKAKLLEETQEFLEFPCIEELADVYEVVVALLAYTGTPLREMFEVAVRKRRFAGGFTGRVFLEEVDDRAGKQSTE
jgi:predicted house-cleaning noncanonical NTP pyrophosphatase (MazG superfamily)